MKGHKTERMIIRVSKADKASLEKFAAQHDVPAAQIVREAVKLIVAGAAKS